MSPDEAEQLDQLRRAAATEPDSIARALPLAGKLYSHQLYAETAEVFDGIVRHHPEYALGWSGRGLARWMRDQNGASGLPDVEEAIRLKPEEPDYRVERARMLLALERGSDAFGELQEALRLKPGYDYALAYMPAALQKMGRVWFDAGYYPQAFNAFDAWVAFEPGNAAAWGWRARSRAFKDEDMAAALDDFAESVRLDPAIGWVRAERAAALARSGRHDEADLEIATAFELDPDDELNHTCADVVDGFRANAAFRLGDYDLAERRCDRRIARDPANASAWSFRGFTRWKRSDAAAEGLSDLAEAARLSPEDPSERTSLARGLTAVGRHAEAASEIEAALALDAGNSEALEHAVGIWESAFGFEAAEGRARMQLVRCPENATLLLAIGKLLQRNKEHEQAITFFQESLRLGGDEVNTLVQIRLAAGEIHDWQLLDETCARLIELEPESVSYRLDRGNAAVWLEEYDLAQRMFEEVLVIEPNNAWAVAHLGNLLGLSDDFDRTLVEFTRALELDPTLDVFRSIRATLREAFDDHAGMLEDLDVLVQRNPENLDYLWRRSDLHALLGHSEQADADADAALAISIRSEEKVKEDDMVEDRMKIWNAMQAHFGAVPLEQLTLTERHFPPQVGADVQKALDALPQTGFEIKEFWATEHAIDSIATAYTKNRRDPVRTAPPRRVEVDIGEESPVRVLLDGLWLLQREDTALGLLMKHDGNFIKFQIASVGAAGAAATAIFQHIEATVKRSPCYRGKVLSLEHREMYSGQSQGLRVHKLKPVPRDQVILSEHTLDQLDRNVTRFIGQRPKLVALGLNGKKGLLFHGPPGTGKTHTIHYLAQGLKDQTTFILSAEQIGALTQYMTLARLYQPSLVVIEDVDLIARSREAMRSPGEEVMLNRLLNEMDGLQTDSEIMFVLTTNRPESLEAALAARPGRIDQAIEFPLPDDAGRTRLAKLYCGKLALSSRIVERITARTSGLSASFIKELMRRAAQFALERGDEQTLVEHDVETALEEMLLRASALNRRLLGFAGAE